MVIQLYLSDLIRKEYINDLTFIKTMFEKKISPIFLNIEKETKDYQDKVWKDVGINYCNDENTDPFNYIDFVQEKAQERYSLLSLMKYRNICMWICCLCQVLEQQLYTFVIHEAEAEKIEYDKNDIKKGFSFCKEVFELHQ